MQKTILVIEDEKDILDLEKYNLEQAGFKVLTAVNGLEGLNLAQTQDPDLIVLDLMLPGLDGKEVCRRVRGNEATRNIPVIMLTAKVEEIDLIIGFEIGADDYMTKPFSPRELVLRIKAVLKRTQPLPAPLPRLAFPGLVIDPAKHRLEVDGLEVILTATEFKLIQHLAENAGLVLSRDQLLDQVWGYNFEGYGRTVDTHIRRLRKKLGSQKERIETIRGVGYRFREEI